jgi:hypothetical protein
MNDGGILVFSSKNPKYRGPFGGLEYSASGIEKLGQENSGMTSSAQSRLSSKKGC